MRTIKPLVLGLVVAAALASASVAWSERSEFKALAAPSEPLAAKDIPELGERTNQRVSLGIPDRAQGPNAPPSGWCGESAIQQAMLFYGAWVPQALINKAGNPRHADLYASDIPVALRNLGVAFSRSPRFGTHSAYLTWLRGQVRAGVPVFVGVKLHPTKHPAWGLDHFVIVEGFDASGLMLNTTWDEQRHRSDAQLDSNKEGISFNNGGKGQYAISITGPKRRLPGEVRAQLIVEAETSKSMKAVVKCEGLTPKRRVVVNRASGWGEPGRDVAAFVAKGESYAFRVELDPSKPAIFRCREIER